MSAPGIAAARHVCSACGLPAVFRGGRWEHAEAADAVFCSIFRDVPLITADTE